MTLLNAVLVRVADAVLTPLAALPPAAGVVLLALVTALAILGLMRLTSDQAALAAVKRQIQADLFEMRLFNDDLRGLLRAQWAVLVHNARYLRLSLVPLVCTAVPLVFAIAQLQAWYGYTGVPVGVPVAVSADLGPGIEPGTPQLDGDGVTVDGPAAYFPSLRQVVWRVVPSAPGTHVLHLRVQGADLEKRVVAGDAVTPARAAAARGVGARSAARAVGAAARRTGHGHPGAVPGPRARRLRPVDALARPLPRRVVPVRAALEEAARGGHLTLDQG